MHGQTYLDVDLWAEAQLAPEVRPSGSWSAAASGPRVLLTGASGFVGGHILRALLDRASAPVVCLVRAADAAAARQRVLSNLERLKLRLPEDPQSLVAVNADLAAPGFGLPEAKFDELARDVDVVIHNAAAVHMTQPYAALRDANVQSTREMYRFASTRRTKRVCHISSLSVFLGCQESVEASPPPYSPGSTRGYFATKWVSERVAWAAQERGFSGCVIRLGWIAGDSRYGLIGRSDAMTMLIRACTRLGAAPRLAHGSLCLTPVDAAARAIVDAALHDRPNQPGINLYASHRIPEQALWDRLATRGNPVRVVPTAQWLELLHQRFPLMVSAFGADAPVVIELDAPRPPETVLPSIDDSEGRALLAAANPDLVSTEELLDVYIRAWLGR